MMHDYTGPSSFVWGPADVDRWSELFHQQIMRGFNMEQATLIATAELALDGKF